MGPLVALALQLVPAVPQLLRWLNGDNPGPIAQKVINVAQTVSGATTPEEAVKSILAEPDKQRAFQLALAQESDALEAAYLKDRADARARDIALQKDGRKNVRADNLAYAAVTMLFVVIVMLFLPGLEIADTKERLLYIVLGALLVIVKDVYGFEFGSSKDSARTSQAMIDTIQTQAASMNGANGH